MDMIRTALMKYILDCPALNSVAKKFGNSSVIKVPATINTIVYIKPYLIPSLTRFLVCIPYEKAMIGVIASLKPKAINNTNCCTL